MLLAETNEDRRTDDRIQSLTFGVSLDGRQYPAIDWSVSGVLVADYDGELGLGDEIEGSFRICKDMKRHAFKAVVVRREAATGCLALRYTELSLCAVAVLEAFVTSRQDT